MRIDARLASLERYAWHVISMLRGRGKTAEFRKQGHSPWLLPLLVIRAQVAAWVRLPRLLAERRRIRKTRRISVADFQALLARHSISLRRVAEL
jgi:hypothetical protein